MASRRRVTQWALEYSHEQRCLHIQTLKDAVDANRRMFAEGVSVLPDFIPIFVGSRRDCERMAKLAEKLIKGDRECAWVI